MPLGIVGISEMQKCELKYVIHSLGDQFRLQVNTLTFSNRSLDGETIYAGIASSYRPDLPYLSFFLPYVDT